VIYETNSTDNNLSMMNLWGEDRLFATEVNDRLRTLDRLRYRFSSPHHCMQWKFTFSYEGEIPVVLRKWTDFYIDDENGTGDGPQKCFLNIHLLVKMLLSLPATSAPSERVFSCSGFLKPAIRSRLAPHLVEWLTIIRTYIKCPQYNFSTLFPIFLNLLWNSNNGKYDEFYIFTFYFNYLFYFFSFFLIFNFLLLPQGGGDF
jgi:hypothetical protein